MDAQAMPSREVRMREAWSKGQAMRHWRMYKSTAYKGGGLCMRHRRRKKKLCSFEGCTNQSEECAKSTRQRQTQTMQYWRMYKQSVQWGLCMRHGAKVQLLCSTGGCTNHAKNGGICRRQGAKNQIYRQEGCTNYLYASAYLPYLLVCFRALL